MRILLFLSNGWRKPCFIKMYRLRDLLSGGGSLLCWWLQVTPPSVLSPAVSFMPLESSQTLRLTWTNRSWPERYCFNSRPKPSLGLTASIFIVLGVLSHPGEKSSYLLESSCAETMWRDMWCRKVPEIAGKGRGKDSWPPSWASTHSHIHTHTHTANQPTDCIHAGDHQ